MPRLHREGLQSLSTLTVELTRLQGYCKYEDKCQYAHGNDELRGLYLLISAQQSDTN